MEDKRPLWHLALPITLFVVTVNFLTMPREEYFGDAFSVRTEAVVFINTGSLAVPTELCYGEHGQYFYENSRGNRYPKPGLLNTFLYAPALLLEKIATGTLEVDSLNRAFFLNLFNVGISALTAFYLVLLARRYTSSRAITAIFVLASLYSTFWWNYLRAQTFENHLTLFLIAFYYHFVTALDRGHENTPGQRTSNGHFLGAAVCFGSLCLCKTTYLLLLPSIGAILAWTTVSIPREDRKRFCRQSLFFWLPLVVVLYLLGVANWYRFDSPFATGYTQWQEERQLFKPENLFPALRGFLFGSHYSVFLHFPTFLFALAGWPSFIKRYRVDGAAAALFGFELLLLTSMYLKWHGEAAYGPRYLLPILPLISLPFIEYLKWLAQLFNKAAKPLLIGSTAMILTYSFLLQICVNTCPFFFCYDLKDLLESKDRSTPAGAYLWRHQFGTVTRDFLFYKMGCPSSFTNNFLSHLTPGEVRKMHALADSVRSNYYWFPDLFHGLAPVDFEQSTQQ